MDSLNKIPVKRQSTIVPYPYSDEDIDLRVEKYRMKLLKKRDTVFRILDRLSREFLEAVNLRKRKIILMTDDNDKADGAAVELFESSLIEKGYKVSHRVIWAPKGDERCVIRITVKL
jgi:hypothetical protein